MTTDQLWQACLTVDLERGSRIYCQEQLQGLAEPEDAVEALDDGCAARR
jgi:hypothetical protein